MQIQAPHTEQKIISLASSIGRDPVSWTGWLCLYFDVSNLRHKRKEESTLLLKSLIEAYLGDIEGYLYICRDQSLHFVCNNVGYETLQHAAKQIGDFLECEDDESLNYHIFDLAIDAYLYAQMVLEKSNGQSEIYKENIFKETFISGSFDCKLNKADNNINLRTKVLLVEDDPVTRWMVRNILKNECDLITASSANKAFSIYSSYKPDIVFLDIGLPDRNGREVLNWIIRNDPGACVVMFSSNNTLDNISGALEDGASGFITKPFLKEHLMHYIYTRVN
jgi:two-component system, chemotaxis family, chemotaxis protein CheY